MVLSLKHEVHLFSYPGQFDRPIKLAVDPQGHVFTVEFGGDRVQKFSNTGKFIRP